MRTKTILFTLIIGFALMLCACHKTSCKVCTIKEYPTMLSHSETICGTDKELANKEAQIKNDCAQAQIDYPGYIYTCSCE